MKYLGIANLHVCMFVDNRSPIDPLMYQVGRRDRAPPDYHSLTRTRSPEQLSHRSASHTTFKPQGHLPTNRSHDHLTQSHDHLYRSLDHRSLGHRSSSENSQSSSTCDRQRQRRGNHHSQELGQEHANQTDRSSNGERTICHYGKPVILRPPTGHQTVVVYHVWS